MTHKNKTALPVLLVDTSDFLDDLPAHGNGVGAGDLGDADADRRFAHGAADRFRILEAVDHFRHVVDPDDALGTVLDHGAANLIEVAVLTDGSQKDAGVAFLDVAAAPVLILASQGFAHFIDGHLPGIQRREIEQDLDLAPRASIPANASDALDALQTAARGCPP